jgi:hypothetical protein
MAQLYIGEDALGQLVGYGDLVAVTKSTLSRNAKREFMKGIVTDITPKSGFKLANEDGTLIIDRYSGNQIVFPQRFTVLIVHADELDNYRRSIINWEKINTEKAGS